MSRAGDDGVGAIVFTDIVGFTEFTAVRGDQDALALLELQELGPVVMRGIPAAVRLFRISRAGVAQRRWAAAR